MPEPLAPRLRRLGHEVDSIDSLRLKGLDNGTLYREVAGNYDLFFTRDAVLARNVTRARVPQPVKVLRVTLPQQRVRPYIEAFVAAFEQSDWSAYANGADWP
jgi:hypothetical protein